MITVTINGKKLEAQEGEMILTVARSAGIEIPALCAEDRLAPYNSCGTCVVDVEGMGIVKSCSTPVREGMVVTTDSPEVEDTRRTAIELLLSNHWGDCVAPCQQACPAHTDCQGYVGLTANKMFEESLQLLYEALPFPAVFGRICPAPCEDACRRQIADEPVQIRHIKRFVGDYGIDYLPSILPDTGKVIAVVGGGPAGLSAAYFLRRRGHTVHVFDAMPKMGGMLRYGIPDYRLPQDVLDREIDVLRRMNIVFYNGKRLGKDIDYDELKAQYDAVFLGLGAWGLRSMGLPGEEHPAVMQGSEFLRKVNEGERPILPKKVAVIGGGNTAMDAARSAIRLGAEVTVLYRRGQEQMPALEHEVEEAEEEGIVFSYLTQPVEFISDGATLSAVKCVRMELGEPDDSGRRRPVPVEGSEFEVEAGMALLAVGQMVDTSSLAESGISLDRRGMIVANERTGQTSDSKVFAGGDVVTGPSIAVEAVGAAHRAADAIDRFLRGEQIELPSLYIHVKHDVTRKDIGNPARSPRIRTPVRPVAERITDFDEYESGLSEEEAMIAGQRCLECGCMAYNSCLLREYATKTGASQDAYSGDMLHKGIDERHPFIVHEAGKCISCGRCIRVCSEVCGVNAIDFVNRGIVVDVQAPFDEAWQDSDCVSCGACVDICPTGALQDRSVIGKQVPHELEETKTTCLLCGMGCDVKVLSMNGKYMRTTVSDPNDVICARGRYGWHTISNAKRITEPMVRCGSSLVEVPWDEALKQAREQLDLAKGNIAVFGTGLLTCEEGWLVARLSEGLRAGAPTFDVMPSCLHTQLNGDRVVPISALESSELIVVVGERNGHEKVVLDVLLRKAIKRGATVASVGANVPGAQVELEPKDLAAFIADLELGNVAPLFVIEEDNIPREALGQISKSLSAHADWRMTVIPATVNAMGLRRLGFLEELRPSTRAWLAIGADPMATPSGRQQFMGVETLVAVSSVRTATTDHAHVVFPMRLPYETRGHVLTVRGEKELSIAAKSPIESETWEVLIRLASAFGITSLPWQFEALSEAAMCAVREVESQPISAGTTQSSMGGIIDTRLKSLGI